MESEQSSPDYPFWVQADFTDMIYGNPDKGFIRSVNMHTHLFGLKQFLDRHGENLQGLTVLKVKHDGSG